MVEFDEKYGEEFEGAEIDPDEPVFTTGVVCRLLGIPIWVLKQLDAEGIVSPPRERTGMARLYSTRELKKVHHCWVYIEKHNVKVGGLKIILELEKRLDSEE